MVKTLPLWFQNMAFPIIDRNDLNDCLAGGNR